MHLRRVHCELDDEFKSAIKGQSTSHVCMWMPLSVCDERAKNQVVATDAEPFFQLK